MSEVWTVLDEAAVGCLYDSKVDRRPKVDQVAACTEECLMLVTLNKGIGRADPCRRWRSRERSQG